MVVAGADWCVTVMLCRLRCRSGPLCLFLVARKAISLDAATSRLMVNLHVVQVLFRWLWVTVLPHRVQVLEVLRALTFLTGMPRRWQAFVMASWVSEWFQRPPLWFSQDRSSRATVVSCLDAVSAISCAIWWVVLFLTLLAAARML